MTKVEKGPEGPKESKIKNFQQLLGFLEKEFGKNVTEEFFKHLLEARASHAKPREVRSDRLKHTEVTPMTLAQLNSIVEIQLKKLEADLRQIALRYPDGLEENIRKEKRKKKEVLNAMKGKEIVMDGEGNIEIKRI